MTRHAISIEVDDDRLTSYTDTHLAALWHVAQANPGPQFDDSVAGDLAERIGREIIRRWLHATPPELWSHQGRHHYHHQLGKFAKYVPGGPSGSPEWHRGTWVPKAADEDGSGVDR